MGHVCHLFPSLLCVTEGAHGPCVGVALPPTPAPSLHSLSCTIISTNCIVTETSDVEQYSNRPCWQGYGEASAHGACVAFGLVLIVRDGGRTCTCVCG